MYFKLALRNVKKNFKDYSIYFLTLVFGVSIFYAFNSISHQASVLNMSKEQGTMFQLLGTLIGGVSVFIAVILGFLIVYANRFLIKRRKKEFGMYLTLGMNKQNVSKILIFETLTVGLVSLCVGLLAGFALSQGLLYVTAMMFKVKITAFTFAFSQTALMWTIASFAIIFVIALIFNVTTVSRCKIIDLIHADRFNETIKLRNAGISALLFLASLALIGAAYTILLKNGLVINGNFYLSTALVCVGTTLFFYSLSGFLLRVLQANKRYYYRGLNAFTLRQLNAKINTAFISITLVCLTLFLAITSTCTGFATVTTFNKSLKDTTPFDASYTVFLGDSTHKQDANYRKEIEADKYDMASRMRKDIPNYDRYVKEAHQINFYSVKSDFKKSIDINKSDEISAMFKAMFSGSPVPFVKLSDYNTLQRMEGKKPLTLAANEAAMWADFNQTQGAWRAIVKDKLSFKLGETALTVLPKIQTSAAQTTAFNSNLGALIVNDSLIKKGANIEEAHLNINLKQPYDKDAKDWSALVAKTYPKNHGWPFQQGMTDNEVYDQSVGLSSIVTYLALYIGFILIIACAAILSLQQLSEAADNVYRYGLLAKIGANEHLIDKALFRQMAVYFLFPALLAIAHSVVALRVSTDLVKLFGHLDIRGPLILTVALLMVVYGGYFLVTYLASRAMIRSRA